MNHPALTKRWAGAALAALLATATLAAVSLSTANAAAPKAAAKSIKIGYVNNEGAAFSLPEFRVGGEVAIDYINKHGGVKGAKIQEVKCLADGSPEASINCANKFIEAKVTIAYAGIDVSSDAALPLLSKAGIPYVTSNSWGTAQKNDPNAFILHSASAAYTIAPLKVLQGLGAKKVTVIVEDTAAGQDFIKNVVKPIGEGKLGLQITPITVDPANPDWTAAVTTAMSSNPDGIWGQLTEPGCIGMVTATNALGYKGPVFAGSCSVYIDVLKDKAVGTYTQGDMFLPSTSQYAPPNIQKNLALYTANMKAAGQDKYLNGFAVAPYSAIFELRAILESIKGPINATSIKAAFNSGKTTPGTLGGDLKCGQKPWPTETSHCRADILIWKVVAGPAGPTREPAVKGFQDYSSVMK